MLKAYRYRIYPTDEQKVLLSKTFGCCRWFYNFALNLTNETYKATGKGLSRNEIINKLPELKQDLPEQNPEGKAVGINLGVKDFCITSEGSKYGNPNHYRKHEQKLAKKQKGSNNRNQARKTVAKVKCGAIHDRDINAAQNIRDEGLRLLAVGHIASASGERVRPSKGTAFVRHPSVKEESPVIARQGA